MDITDRNIDGRKAFDWGKTSSGYAGCKYPAALQRCRAAGYLI